MGHFKGTIGPAFHDVPSLLQAYREQPELLYTDTVTCLSNGKQFPMSFLHDALVTFSDPDVWPVLAEYYTEVGDSEDWWQTYYGQWMAINDLVPKLRLLNGGADWQGVLDSVDESAVDKALIDQGYVLTKNNVFLTNSFFEK